MSAARTPVCRVVMTLDSEKGRPFGSPPASLVSKCGYLVEEFLLEGTAQAYAPAPGCSRCQRRSVSGVTSDEVRSHTGRNRCSTAKTMRSSGFCGRFT
jgi:hypothetical protein